MHTSGPASPDTAHELDRPVIQEYLSMKKVDPAKAKAFLKESMEIKENATEAAAVAVGDAALLAAQRFAAAFNNTFG